MTDQKHKYTFNQRTPHTRPGDNDFVEWLKSSSKEKEDLSRYPLLQIFSRLLIREEELPPETQSKMWEQIQAQCKPATQKRAFSFRLPVKYAALIILLLLPLTYIYIIAASSTTRQKKPIFFLSCRLCPKVILLPATSP